MNLVKDLTRFHKGSVIDNYYKPGARFTKKTYNNFYLKFLVK